ARLQGGAGGAFRHRADLAGKGGNHHNHPGRRALGRVPPRRKDLRRAALPRHARPQRLESHARPPPARPAVPGRTPPADRAGRGRAEVARAPRKASQPPAALKDAKDAKMESTAARLLERPPDPVSDPRPYSILLYLKTLRDLRVLER